MSSPFNDDPKYNDLVEQKVRLHDVLAEDSDNVVSYLTQFKYELTADYQTRQSNTAIFNLYKKIIDSVIGITTRKPPTWTVDDTLTEEVEVLTNNVDLQGKSLDTILTTDIFPSAMSGFGAILVDYSETLSRPYWRIYKNSEIRHTKFKFKDGILNLERIVFIDSETREKDTSFEYEEVELALVIRLNREGNNPQAVWEQWERVTDEDTSNSNLNLVSDGDSLGVKVNEGFFKDQAGATLEFLPVAVFYGEKIMDGVGQPPLYAAARKNIVHMNIQSGYENGLTVANFPMLAFFSDKLGGSLQPNGDPSKTNSENDLVLGPRVVWEIGDSEARLDFVEWKGSSLQETRNYISKLESDTAAMGIQILTEQRTQRTKAQWEGESMVNTSSLEKIVSSVESAINWAFEQSLKLMGVDTERVSRIVLNRDYMAQMADSSLLRELKDAWLDRMISGETAIQTLVENELIPEGKTFEQEQEKIAQEQTELLAE